MKPLTVYKASAGSGKTFTLAVEYIKLLIENPTAYRQTLAVTFTNKATEEMKMRILSQLYGIWKGLDDSKDYTEKVCSQLGVTPEHASARAGEALKLLLHNYGYFRVETIDSFFQSVLRNMARELELNTNLRIGLNDAQVEELAVDQMIDSLKPTDKMLQWLLRYIMDNISEDRSWNVIWQIKQFGKTIFRDYYKQESEELNKVLEESGFFDNYSSTLRRVRQKAKEQMKQIGDTFMSTIEAEGLSVDDFSNKNRGVCSIFLKLQRGEFDETVVTKTVADAVGNPAKWYAKSSAKAQQIHSLAERELDRLLRQAIEEQPRQWKLFKSADLTLRHLDQLRLLESIELKVRELNESANRFLLSDTQHLLHALISGSDSPFIYEKVGSQLEHIMIDEFQDTSTVQWQNFKVLLDEAMSHKGSSSLIVGDVKQSIYRWRSGDWRLLADIKSQFSHPEQVVDIKKLDTNYRSSKIIIDFNNAFFTEAAKAENAQAYDDVVQKCAEGRLAEGFVSVTLLPQADYSAATLDAVAEQIERLKGFGVAENEIAILVRNNSHIPLIANHLLEALPGTTVVSDEAFRLDASPAVMLIINALHFLFHPGDNIARAYLSMASCGTLDGELPKEYSENAEELKRMPLYDLTEQLFTIFVAPHKDEPSPFADQSAYLCAFFDSVTEYVSENPSDPVEFLKEWDENICSETIQSPEVNGVRIISIHKSKGLEFPHVIIPFCDWQMEHNDILWCKPVGRPFDQLPLVPIDYSQKGMRGTIYEKDYEEEHAQNTIDNLNLLYVAFTRASKSLTVIGKRGSKNSRSALIEQVLPSLDLKGSILTGRDDEKGTLHFEYGQMGAEKRKAGKKKESQNPFTQESTPVATDIEVSHIKMEFWQSNSCTEFVSADPDEEAGRQTQFIKIGNVLHNVFSNIRTAADTANALQALEQEGVIYTKDITREKLQHMVQKRMADPRVAEWFSERWTLYNECDILLPDGQTRRPDRVMTDGKQTIVVDFKFGREQYGHHEQVKDYMRLLSEMGLNNVKGYLWYVYSNDIVEV